MELSVAFSRGHEPNPQPGHDNQSQSGHSTPDQAGHTRGQEAGSFFVEPEGNAAEDIEDLQGHHHLRWDGVDEVVGGQHLYPCL